jgi:hypothetical protein
VNGIETVPVVGAPGVAGQGLVYNGTDYVPGSFLGLTVVAESANFNAVAGNIYDCTASLTGTLPVPTPGATVGFIRDGNNGITITPNGTNTINGVNASIVMATTLQVTDPVVVLLGISTTAWVMLIATGEDYGQGLRIAGTFNFNSTLIAHLTAKTANYTIAPGDFGLSFSGANLVGTFGASLTNGAAGFVQNVGTTPVTLAASGAGSIVGPTQVQPGNGVFWFVASGGANPVIYIVAPGVAPGQTGSIFISTRWYPQVYTAGTPLQVVANSLYMIPFVVGVQHQFTAIGVNLTIGGVGGTPVVRMGIYADNGAGYPGALIQDCGTTAATGTGAITITGLTQTLAPGLYWLGVVSQGATTQPTFTTPTAVYAQAVNLFGLSAAANPSPAASYVLGAVSAGLPNPFTAGQSLAAVASSPLVTLQAA